MKKIFLLIQSVLFCSLALCQPSPSSDVVTATMPAGSRLMSKKEVIDFTKNYKRSQISPDRKNIYQSDGLIISFWDLSVNPGFKKSLEASRSEMLAVFKLDKEAVINFSKIIDINNIHFLVYEYQKGDEVFLRFQSEFNKSDKNICGIIQCKKPDEDKAQKALSELLNSVHFKE